MNNVIILGITLSLSINLMGTPQIELTQNKTPTTYINTSIAEEIETRENMLGRFIIPNDNIDVACFNSREQKIVDNKDSAAMFGQGDMYIIADHTNQGFNRICDCVVGETAYFDNGYKLEEYICTSSFIGHNTGEELTDANYNSIMFNKNTGGITCYTCLGNWKNVWIVFFQPIQK